MDEIFKVLFIENEKEKRIFYWEKYNFETIGNSVNDTEYLAFGKILLSKL